MTDAVTQKLTHSCGTTAAFSACSFSAKARAWKGPACLRLDYFLLQGLGEEVNHRVSWLVP